jgi:ribosome-binding factor A
MPSKRIARLNEQFKRELSELIRTHVRDPRVGVVTVTGVEMASDLGSARVFVRIIGDQAEFKGTLEGLDAAAPFLRGRLGRLLHIRRIPELRFREDRSMEHAQRIEKLLSEVDVPEEDPADEADSDTTGEAGSEPDDETDSDTAGESSSELTDETDSESMPESSE